MSKIAQIILNKGSLREIISNVIPVNTGGVFKQTDKGHAIYLDATADLNGYGKFTGIKTIVFVIKPSGNTKLFLDNNSDKLEITGGNYSGTGLTENTVFKTGAVNTDTASFNQWQMVISEFSTGIDFATDFEIDPTANLYLGYEILLYNSILTADKKNKLYQNFLTFFPNATTKSKFINYPDYVDGDITYADDFRYEPADGSNISPKDWIKGTGSYKITELTTDDIVLSSLKKGTKILECTSTGIVSFQSNQVYGTWVFSVEKNNAICSFKFSINDLNNLVSGYTFAILLGGDIKLYSGVSLKLATTLGHVVNGVMYEIKITKAITNEISVYIRGGNYGKEFTLVDVTGGSGSNPVTDGAFTTSKYTILDFDTGDKITNIKYTKGII